MDLFHTILHDLTTAFKEGRTREVETLRLLKAALHNREIEKRSADVRTAVLSDEEVLACLRREVKKRKEAMTLYIEGHLEDRAAREEEERKILERYLPALMDEKDVVEYVRACVVKMDGATRSHFGKAMKEVMQGLKGKADAQIIQRVVQEECARVYE